MKRNPAGIVGYGVYIPVKRIETEVIVKAREQGRPDLQGLVEKVRDGLLLRYKSIADYSEDVTTMATEASENALAMADIDPKKIGTVVLGSESKPYAVGSSARHAASFVGIGERVYVSDLEGACNSAMQGMDFVKNQVEALEIDYGLVIGSDIAQAPIGDPLEYACGSGAAAYVIGRDKTIADIVDVAPYSSLYMDFWRREGVPVPSHFGKTTVDAYITHVTGAIKGLLERHKGLKLSDFDAITFHQPSGYLPLKTCRTLSEPDPNVFGEEIAERMKLTEEDVDNKVKPWLKVLDMGNTYAASTPITLAAILDNAQPGQNILAVSYGSGAYSVAMWFKVKDEIEKKRGLTPKVEDYINRRREIPLNIYLNHIRERMTGAKRFFMRSRIIGVVEGVEEAVFVEAQICEGCKRIYYPPRKRCLRWECEKALTTLKYPRTGILKEYRPIEIHERFKSNYSFYKGGQVLLVDCELDELRKNMPVELVIRRLNYEGREGIIQYGPCYRPLFRKALTTSI
ncbi:MAG: hydroxymethylglutaryl-CoA synthase [Candidatus Bathyarchaeia archaeon]